MIPVLTVLMLSRGITITKKAKCQVLTFLLISYLLPTLLDPDRIEAWF